MMTKRISLDVWTPDKAIEMPSTLKKVVKKLTIPEGFGKLTLRKDSGVSLARLCGHDGILCDGFVGWHDDAHLDVKYTAMFLLRNDTNAYVRAKNKEVVLPQDPGTLMLLDFRCTHALWHDLGEEAPYGVWAALCKDYNRRPSREDVERHYRTALYDMQKNHAEKVKENWSLP